METASNTRTHSSLKRAAHIAQVLAHHELWYIIEVLDLERFVPVHLHRNTAPHQKSPELRTQPEHVRMALEELGPTFMKLGQMLSIHADLLPRRVYPCWCTRRVSCMEYLPLWSPLNDVLDILKFDQDEFLRMIAE